MSQLRRVCTELLSHLASVEQVLFEETIHRDVRSLAFSLINDDVSNLLGRDNRVAEAPVSGFGNSYSANLRPLWEGAEGGSESLSDKTAHFPNGTQLQEQLFGGICTWL